jgi:hypothetical protein
MRGVWLIVVCATAVCSSRSQDLDSLAVSIPSDFEISDSPCTFRHDPSVEKVLQVAAVKVDSAKPPGTDSVVFVEMRNASARSITAYILTFSQTRGGKTNYFGARGKDLVYELALAQSARRAAPSGSSFSPGERYRLEIWRGRVPGQIEVYPCVAVFDDGTGIGPSEGLRSVQTDRWVYAKTLETLITELGLARDSADPKSTLLLRAKRIPQVRAMVGPNGNRIRIGGLGPSRDLETTAKELPETRDTRAIRKFLTGRIAALRAFREAFLQQSVLSRPK